MSPLLLALVATDPITEEGVTAALRGSSQVAVVPQDAMAGAEAGLVVARQTDGRILSILESLDTRFTNPGRPLVLVADSIVAARLNYSERTIKAILHAAITRLRLRNRAHVVAYAVRSGAV
jgi:hypothetical protein